MKELFYKLEMSHKNPYEGVKPIPVKKVETVYEKARYLQNMVGITHNEAMKFVTQYPHHDSAQVTEFYFSIKN